MHAQYTHLRYTEAATFIDAGKRRAAKLNGPLQLQVAVYGESIEHESLARPDPLLLLWQLYLTAGRLLSVL